MATLLIVAGGSGGHLVPGISIAEEWLQQHPTDNICFVTSGRAVERFFKSDMEKFRVIELPVPPLSELKSKPWKFCRDFRRSLISASKLLYEIQPQAVIGMGAMTSVPVILSAWWKRVPIFLHEQNKIAGRATSYLAHLARIMFTTFEQTTGMPQSAKVIWTGNPVRKQLQSNFSQTKTSPRVLLVLGGSQGARHLNQALIELVKLHPEVLTEYKLVHQVGSGFDIEHLPGITPQWERHEFLHPIIDFYAQAEVVICRAGAGTLAELALWKLPAILVPFPQATRGHQLANARDLAIQQAALLVEECATPEQTATKLWEQLELLRDETVRQQMKTAISQFATPDSASKICGEVAKLIHP